MLNTVTPRQSLALVFVALLVVIGSAWAFEFAGYLPCELCLKQRWAYYLAIPLSAIFALTSQNHPQHAKTALLLIGFIMLASCIFGIYHAGVEWKFWAGPSSCTGTESFKSVLPDLSKPGVMCDQPAIRILGLSLAGYNALISAAVSLFAFSKSGKS